MAELPSYNPLLILPALIVAALALTAIVLGWKLHRCRREVARLEAERGMEKGPR